MATIVVTNQKASQSLQGQDVIITLNGDDTTGYLASISEGQLVEVDSSGNQGTVSFVDYFGTSFKITPLMPIGTLESDSTPGYLSVSETLTITT